MANLGVTGGIGAGIMQGLQFMRQREGDARQEQALQNQSAMVDIHKQDQAFKVQEQDRKGRMLKGYQTIMADPDLSDAERYSKFAREHAKDMTPDEHMAVKKVVEPMVQAFGTDAIHRAVNARDLSGIEKVLSIRAPGSKAAFSGDGKRLVVSTPDARQTDYDWSGFATAHGLYGYLDQQKAQAKSALDTRKTEAEITKITSEANKNDRLPQLNLGAGARGAGGKEEKGDSGFPFDTKDLEAVTPIDPATSKTDPQKLANIGANAESILRLNVPLQKSPRNALSIAAALEKGELKPEAIYDPATNTYFKGVKFGSGAVRIASESDIDPDQFHGNKPGTTSVRLAADKAWLPQYLGTLKDLKQRASLEAAIKADTPQGQADRNKIIEAYDKFQSSGVEVPLFLRQQYNALRTGDRLKVAPAEKKPAAPRFAPGGIGRKPLPDTSGYGAGGTKGTSLAGEAFDGYIADPVVGFFKDSAAKARAE